MSSETLVKYKAAKCGELLAKSALNDDIKKALAENIKNATEIDLDKLIYALEREHMELESLEKKLSEMGKEEDEEWKKLEKKQEEMSQKIADEFLADIVRENI